MPEKIQTLMDSLKEVLKKIGVRRLVVLALVGVALFGAILFSSFYLTRPTYETLYVGLSRDDINRIGLALGEAGIKFDVSTDGASVRVPVGTAAKSRMLLAEKGLPTSNNAGYELFDNMGSLGLTSFMQEVTKQRALEGEIARTIQAVRGVKAARVHIVLPDKGSFRHPNQKPTASVVIKTEGNFSAEAAQSIRQLVAAAVPSLNSDNVTVMDTAGHLLVSGAGMANSSSILMTSLESRVSQDISENIRHQLAPIVGINHFQTSVQVTLNTDHRQTNETIYDPDSRVERSIRSFREKNDSTNPQNNNAVTVEQNIPQESLDGSNSGSSTNKHDRQEETANYEINTKTISTVSNGYSINKLSVAVVIDRNKLKNADGKNLSGKELEDHLSDIEKMVSTAAGLDSKRGDMIHVTAINFIGDANDLQPVSAPFWQSFNQYASGLVNGLILIIAISLILVFGVRPMMRDMSRTKLSSANNNQDAFADNSLKNLSDTSTEILDSQGQNLEKSSQDSKINSLRKRMKAPPQNRLEKMIELDEERFAGILRDWIHEDREPQSRAS